MSDPMSDASLSSSRSLGDDGEEDGEDEDVDNAEQEEELEEDDDEDDDAVEDEEYDEGESIADMQMGSPLLHNHTLAEQPEHLHSYGEELGRNSQQENQNPLNDEDDEDDDMDSDEVFMERDDFDSANELGLPADEIAPHGSPQNGNSEPEDDPSGARDHPSASDDLLLEKEDIEAEHEVEEEAEVEENAQPNWLEFLKRPPEEDDGTPEEQAEFVRVLERFFAERNMEFKHPKFYQENLNCLKLWRAVVRLGGHEAVTAGKLWRQVGDTFKPPKSCTTVSWSFRIFYKKALLEYERFKFAELYPDSGQSAPQHDGGSEAQTDALQPRSSQPSFMPNLGRARRDAAARAMQGWHSQRLFANGDIGDPIVKQEKAPSSSVKRAKQLKIGLLRKKKDICLERGTHTARNKSSKSLLEGQVKDENLEEVDDPSYFSAHKRKSVKHDHTKQAWKRSGFNSTTGDDIWVTDEGPEADWVKINVHKARDCFEVYALVPGLLRDEVRIQCEPGGQLVILGEPEDRNSPWGITSFKKVINLPHPIDASQTSAVVTVHGQLFVRVPFSLTHS